MKKFELQIISGLHAGARHNLSRGSFTLGGEDDADLRLLDDEFESVLLSLDLQESGGYAVSSDVEYSLVSAEGRRLLASALLQEGQFLNVGEVWIALQPAGADLSSVPTLIEPELGDTEYGAADSEGLLQGEGLTAEAAAMAASAHSNGAAGHAGMHRKAAAGFVGGVLAILVVGLGFAWAPSEAHTNERGTPAAAKPAIAPVAAAAPVKPEASREQQVREGVTDLLRQHGLQTPVSFRVGYGEISFTGTLDRARVAAFDQMILEVESRFGKEFRVGAQMERTAGTPDFRIREVVLGKDGWIVTDTGKRVIVGGEIGEYRLLAIESNKVILGGPEGLEIQI